MLFPSVMNAIKSFISPETNGYGGQYKELTHLSLRVQEAAALQKAYNSAAETARDHQMIAVAASLHTSNQGSLNMANTLKDEEIEALAKRYEVAITDELVKVGIFTAEEAGLEDVTLDAVDLELTDEAKSRLELKIAALKKMWEDEDGKPE